MPNHLLIESEIFTPELDGSIREVIQNAADSVFNNYEIWNHDFEVNSIEHKGYDGFIPFTNGGYEAIGFQDLRYCKSTGRIPKTVESDIKRLDSDCFKDYLQDQSDFLKAQGLDPENMTISDLWDSQDGVKDDFYHYEASYYENTTFFIQIGVYYYSADNWHNDLDGDSVYFWAGINTDYEYGREKGLNKVYKRRVLVKDITSELLAEIEKEIEKADY